MIKQVMSITAVAFLCVLFSFKNYYYIMIMCMYNIKSELANVRSIT